jgi:hypothetical protein
MRQLTLAQSPTINNNIINIDVADVADVADVIDVVFRAGKGYP